LIKGEKVYLRAPELEDARILSAWLNDRESTKYLDVIYPVSKRFADDVVLINENDGKRIFMIDNMNNKPIGIITVTNIKWEYRNCEIGVVIFDKSERNKGVGKDAVNTALNFIFNEMNMHLVYVNVIEENEVALRLFKSLGFEEEGVLRDRYFKGGKYRNVVVISKTNHNKD
jgi:diamine N-acetyltransferase